MQSLLAQKLLSRVMDWDSARLAEELPILERLAGFKYDEYQQFRPGRKFVETLGLWLDQFEKGEREVAYNFVKNRLVFLSEPEMRHLVEAAFADCVKPMLLRRAVADLGLSPYHIGTVADDQAFHQCLRESLFFGLSDGARMDVFRRSASLDNEQVWQAYEPSQAKAQKFLKDLQAVYPASKFKHLFLIDDFTASGISYIRKEPDGWTGKLVKAIKQFGQGGDAAEIFTPDYTMTIVIYVATKGAATYIREQLAEYFKGKGPVPNLITVYELPEVTALSDTNGDDAAFLALVDLDRYYRDRPLDDHEAKGGTDTVKRGFAGCCLPVVLGHNTPNNSMYLLWADPEENVRGLFPRIVRHKA